MKMTYENNFDKFIEKLESEIEGSLEQVGESLANKVSDAAPVDTGELRDSVGHQVSDKELTIGASAEHALPVEKGSSKRPATPFLENTVMSNVDEVERILRNRLSK